MQLSSAQKSGAADGREAFFFLRRHRNLEAPSMEAVAASVDPHRNLALGSGVVVFVAVITGL